jgi:hypothetical protein
MFPVVIPSVAWNQGGFFVRMKPILDEINAVIFFLPLFLCLTGTRDGGNTWQLHVAVTRGGYTWRLLLPSHMAVTQIHTHTNAMPVTHNMAVAIVSCALDDGV